MRVRAVAFSSFLSRLVMLHIRGRVYNHAHVLEKSVQLKCSVEFTRRKSCQAYIEHCLSIALCTYIGKFFILLLLKAR